MCLLSYHGPSPSTQTPPPKLFTKRTLPVPRVDLLWAKRVPRGSRAPSSGPASRGLSILSTGGMSPTPALTPLATSPSSRWLEIQRAAVPNAPQRPRAGVGEGKRMAQRCPAQRAAWRKVNVCLGRGHELVTKTWPKISHRHPPPPPQLPPSAGSG